MSAELEQHMRDLAERVASHDALDFTPASLPTLEGVVAAIHDQLAEMPDEDARAEARRVLAVRLGAYFGEVLRRDLNGTWITAAAPHDALPAVQVGEHTVHPSAIMLERLMGGPGEPLATVHANCTP